MAGTEFTALIAAGRGSLRESLRAMLVSMLPDAVILEADDTVGAERLLHEHHPDLVVIDVNIPGNHAMQLVTSANAECPRPRCSILVETMYQQAAAMKAGADYVPFKGEPATRLFGRVEQLLQLSAGAANCLPA